MRESASRARAPQIELFHRPPQIPAWPRLPREIMNSHLPIALMRTLRKNAFRWAEKEKRVAIQREAEKSGETAEPFGHDAFETVAVLNDFLDHCRRTGILSVFEDSAIKNRTAYLGSKADTLFSLSVYYVVLYNKFQTSHKLGSALPSFPRIQRRPLPICGRTSHPRSRS